VNHTNTPINEQPLPEQIQHCGRSLGFSHIGITGIDLSDCESDFLRWLDLGFHGEMGYLKNHGLKRLRPAELVPGTVSVITARMNYLPDTTPNDWQRIEFDRLTRPQEAIISVYARGRDYHKVLRSRLRQLASAIEAIVGPFGHRVFTDSAPVFEVELAKRSGQGWRGKHTLLLNRSAGSMFFLGEIFVDMQLVPSPVTTSHCGSCQACIDVCPTQAIVAPYVLDARRCISYLTIEHAGIIPLEFRESIGNRIYGCDDCQLICPWNKFAKPASLADFASRPNFVGQELTQMFLWSEDEFLRNTEGSAIRRIGHERWLRNIAVALGNARRAGADVDDVLARQLTHTSHIVREHVAWALTSNTKI
jgi:epoxyqueuosine reductase